MSSGETMREDRLKKLAILKERGIDPYPAHSNRSHSIKEFLEVFVDHAEKPATLSGRVLSIRKQGGIIFTDIFDGTGRIQFVLQKTELNEVFDLFNDTVDQGDFIEAAGLSFTTKSGQQSLKASGWTMLAKSLSPLPDEWYGIKDEELRLRLRSVDILLNEDLRLMIERRANFWRSIRTFLDQKGFMDPFYGAIFTDSSFAPMVFCHNRCRNKW
ncbi:hypothetical protein H7X87_03990 [Acetobacteraceae bacterium]|nr:hypothetical protein [Candidatus Parcubacteria bacterium]